MRTRKISADEARSLRSGNVQLRKDNDGGKFDVMLRASRGASTWDAATRSARFCMTSETRDRFGDIVSTQGIDLANFEKNPIGLLAHNAGNWPIGDWKDIEKITRGRPPRMEGTLVLHKAGGPIPQIDQAHWMLENGYMRACSIGFIPNYERVEMILSDSGEWTGGLLFTETELAECSLVCVPANTDAMMKSIGNGCDDTRLAREFIEDVLDNWARTPEGVLVSRSHYEKLYRAVSDPSATYSAPKPLKFNDLRSVWPERSNGGGGSADEGSEDWKCGASRDLPVGDDGTWDGGAAAGRMLDAAGIGGDSSDPVKARKGFLAYDADEPDLRGSYKLPFADIVGGTMKAMPAGIRAAASRLPQTDIPASCMNDAQAVIDHYKSKMDMKSLLSFAERCAADVGMRLVDPKRVSKIEAASTAARLRDARRAALRRQKLGMLRIRD